MTFPQSLAGDLMPLGSIISAGSSLLGGIFGNKAKKKEMKMQLNFAQNGIKWKVKDAQEAGIHPLAALGAQTASYQPVGLGEPLANAMSNAGQSLAEGYERSQTKTQQVGSMERKAQQLSLQKMALENELLASQIAVTRQPANPPPMPSVGQRYLVDGQETGSSSPLVSTQALERTVSDPTRPYSEPAAINDVGYVRTKTGYMPVMSNDAKQRLEEDLLGTAMWNMRNRIRPSFQSNNTPPPLKPKFGYKWVYHPFHQEYRSEPIRYKKRSPMARIRNAHSRY